MIASLIQPTAASPRSYLREQYERMQALFDAQPAMVQVFVEAQAGRLAEAVLAQSGRFGFTLPDRVCAPLPQSGQLATMLIPEAARQQAVGRWADRFARRGACEALRSRLNHLQHSPDQAVASSAALIAHATVMHLVHRMLPSGRAVQYRADGDEAIPSQPVEADGGTPALTARGDAIAEREPGGADDERVLVPFVPSARRFYLPQWVAFDREGHLLAGSLQEALAQLASIQRYVRILHMAIALAPYMVADENYQKKRYGMLGQLVNQGRAMAHYQVAEIIRTIRERVDSGRLNRGLSLSLPYFDDQALQLVNLDFDVIPGGRIPFLPVFVVRAVRQEQAKVAQDTRLNPSTRRHLLRELETIEAAFKKETH